MNYEDIENFKHALLDFTEKGCKIKILSYGINGKIVGVGFKPYWTGPIDSKIDKLEINVQDEYGRIIPFTFHNVIGYDVASSNGDGYESMVNTNLNILLYPAHNKREGEKYDKVLVEISTTKA